MKLQNVYERPDRLLLLWSLLQERDEAINISHKAMPSWEEHVRFVESKPYQDWCFILNEWPVGACYLSKQNEIGIFVFKVHQGHGHGKWAIEALMQKHGKKRYLANISPSNDRSAAMFRKLGFKQIQRTYERVPGSP